MSVWETSRLIITLGVLLGPFVVVGTTLAYWRSVRNDRMESERSIQQMNSNMMTMFSMMARPTVTDHMRQNQQPGNNHHQANHQGHFYNESGFEPFDGNMSYDEPPELGYAAMNSAAERQPVQKKGYPILIGAMTGIIVFLMMVILVAI